MDSVGFPEPTLRAGVGSSRLLRPLNAEETVFEHEAVRIESVAFPIQPCVLGHQNGSKSLHGLLVGFGDSAKHDSTAEQVRGWQRPYLSLTLHPKNAGWSMGADVVPLSKGQGRMRGKPHYRDSLGQQNRLIVGSCINSRLNSIKESFG